LRYKPIFLKILTKIPQKSPKSPKIAKISTLSSYKRPKHGDIRFSQVSNGSTTKRHCLHQYFGIWVLLSSLKAYFKHPGNTGKSAKIVKN